MSLLSFTATTDGFCYVRSGLSGNHQAPFHGKQPMMQSISPLSTSSFFFSQLIWTTFTDSPFFKAAVASSTSIPVGHHLHSDNCMVDSCRFRGVMTGFPVSFILICIFCTLPGVTAKIPTSGEYL